MSELETPRARKEVPPPTLSVRLLWWFTIYLAGQVPLVNCALHDQCNILVVVFFPIILGFIFAPIANLFWPVLGQWAGAPLFVLGIAFYLWHLRATLRAKTCWEFDLLLLLLDAVILLNQALVAGMVRSNTM